MLSLFVLRRSSRFSVSSRAANAQFVNGIRFRFFCISLTVFRAAEQMAGNIFGQVDCLTGLGLEMHPVSVSLI